MSRRRVSRMYGCCIVFSGTSSRPLSSNRTPTPWWRGFSPNFFRSFSSHQFFQFSNGGSSSTPPCRRLTRSSASAKSPSPFGSHGPACYRGDIQERDLRQAMYFRQRDRTVGATVRPAVFLLGVL